MNSESLLFFRMIRDFLCVYLPKQKASSENTIKSYKLTLNLLVDYTADSLGISLSEINFTTITRKLIEDFLDWIETDRNCCIATRNQKLACIKSFYKYIGNRDIKLMAYYQELQIIPVKKEIKKKLIKFFSESALKSILDQPNITSKKGFRNLFFMILMYDTAGRNQELLDLHLNDIHISTDSPYVIFTGKGNKTRLVPIMQKTVDHYKEYFKIFHSDSAGNELLFYTIRNGRKSSMSIDNTEKFIRKYGLSAKQENKDVPEKVHPHMFRHSRAMHLYRSGIPLPLLSEWLGHASIETTWIYAYADTRMKRNAIEKATSKINPLRSNQNMNEIKMTENTIKKLYGLT